MRHWLAILLVFAIGAPPIVAQNIPKGEQPIKIEVQLVNVYVSVADYEGGPFTPGLERENFSIYEDGKRREILYFGRGDIPLAACIVADTSESMTEKMDKLREAIKIITMNSNKDDEFCLVAFNKEGIAELVSPFTTATEIQNRIMLLQGGGTTPLWDGTYRALLEIEAKIEQEKRQEREFQETISDLRELEIEIRRVKKKHALIIISDGGDNHSRYSENDIKYLVKELETQIYAIGIYEHNRNQLSPEEKYGPTLLNELAEKTGGRVYSVEKIDNLPAIAAEISASLKEQYYIQFKPGGAKKNPKKEGTCPDYRKIKVGVHPPDGMPHLKVLARGGYCFKQ